MDISQKLDLAVVVIANWLNLILSLIFLNRVFGYAAREHWLGYGTLIMVFPLTIIALANLTGGRGWAFWILPLVMVIFLVVEFVLDYWLKSDFRQTTWLGPYLLVYYLALFAMIGYAFLASKSYGFLTLITYFINLAATFFSYARVGHGA
jgi:hypothetical protein